MRNWIDSVHPSGAACCERDERRIGASPVSVAARGRQRGVGLIELMVGIALGLMTVAVAIGALMVSRGVTGTVSDASQLQQQAAHAFRIIGQQLRQAGSAQLDMAVGKDDSLGFAAEDPVGFLTTGYAAKTDIVNGIQAPTAAEYKLTTGFRNYFEQNTAGVTATTLFRDCLGQGGEVARPMVISAFQLTGDELVCDSAASVSPQPIIRNVADFQVNYLVQTPGAGAPTVRRFTDAASVTNWAQVYAVEVCLELVGEERIDIPTAERFTNCSNAQTPFAGRMHLVFRNTYQIRSQGLFR